MPLILAIDGDRRQADQLAALVRGRLGAELIQATSAGDALQALGDRVPDLIMTSPLLSPFDDGVLAEYLRDLGPTATHVQTLRIPVFGAAPKQSRRGIFSLRRKRQASAAPSGCDPNVFADEIAVYLARAAEQITRSGSQRADAGSNEPSVDTPDACITIEAPAEPAAVAPEIEYVYEPIVYAVDDVTVQGPPPETAPDALLAEPADTAVALSETPSDVLPLDRLDTNVSFSETPMPIVESTVLAEAHDGPLYSEPLASEVDRVTPINPTGPIDPTDPIDPAGPVVSAERTPSFEAALAAIRAAWDPAPLLAHAAPPAERTRLAQDEWGFFDPEQCGFSSLVDALDEVTDAGTGDGSGERPMVRVISYS